VDHSRGPVAVQILVLGTIFTLLAVLTDSAYVLVAGALGGRLRNSRPAGRALAKLSGTIYFGLGVSAAPTGTSHAQAAQS
jgi:threonine/homoserine/homoserine lactone efflux protein